MMLKKLARVVGATTFSLLLCVGSVYAQNQKAGFVNIDRLLKEATMAKTSETKLKQEFESKEREIITLGNSLKSAIDAFEKEAPKLSEAQRQQRQRQLEQQDQAFQDKRDAFQESLNTKKNEELLKLQEAANRVVRQIAESEKYDFILMEAAYINPALDITDKVLKDLNSGK